MNQLSSNLEKLEQALEKLDKAVDGRILRDEGQLSADAEIQRMGADRSRLAEQLDLAKAQSQRLESANREVSRRLVDAMETIRSVLDRQGK